MTEAELAAELAVGVQEVRLLRERGCPARRRGQEWDFDLDEVKDWLRLAALASRRAQSKPPAAEQRIRHEEARRKAALADRYEHEVEVLRDRYMSRAEVEEGRLARIASVRAALEALPDRVDGLTAAQRHQIESEVDRICSEFAGAIDAEEA